MDLELKRTALNCYQMVVSTTVCQEETQESIVPDACPDIQKIVEVCGQVYMTGKQARDGMATVSGVVEVSVLYIPENERCLRRMEMHLSFDAQAVAPGLTPQGTVFASPRLRWAEARALNPRKVLLRADLAIDIRACQPCEVSAVEEAMGEDDGVQQLQETRSAYQLSSVEEKAFTFSESLRLPGQGEPGEILAVRGIPVCTESKLIGSKLIFKGNVEISLLLSEGEKTPEASYHQVPFSQVMELPGVGEDGDCDVKIELTQLDLFPSQEGGRTVELQMEFLAQAMVHCRRTVTLLKDVYSTAWDMETEQEPLTLHDLGDLIVLPQTIREIIETPVSVRQIIDCWAVPGETKQNRENTQMQLSCDLHLTVLYLDEEGEMQSIHRAVTAAAKIECEAQMLCRSRCQCMGEVYATPSAGGIEMRCTAEFQCSLLVQTKSTFISKAKQGEARSHSNGTQPSVVLRLAMPGEGLWDIAKHYGTTKSKILAANELEEEEIPIGKMLLIPRAR